MKQTTHTNRRTVGVLGIKSDKYLHLWCLDYIPNFIHLTYYGLEFLCSETHNLTDGQTFIPFNLKNAFLVEKYDIRRVTMGIFSFVRCMGLAA